MNDKRRSFLKYTGAASLGLSATAEALHSSLIYAAEWKKSLFENRKFTEVLSAVSNGSGTYITSEDIILRAPDKAEDGTKLEVKLTSNIPGTTRIILLVEQNNFPLVADFHLFNDAISNITTRIKLDSTGTYDIIALVHASGVVYGTSKRTSFHIVPCG